MGSFVVTFWGVRGSIPMPSKETLVYGGNTPCVEIKCDDSHIIFDMGTGAVMLGRSMIGKSPVNLHVFFSHFHWDHIQGFPFFAPLFNPRNVLTLYGLKEAPLSLEKALRGQMENPNFPISLDTIPAKLNYRDIIPGQSVFFADVEIYPFPLMHPNPCTGYRINYAGKSVVYGTDNEHGENGIHKPYFDQCKDADLLIFDAAYTDDEYDGIIGPPRKNWGHSTWTQAVKLAKEARVKRIALFHHDFTRTDKDLMEIERLARAQFANCFAAKEGMSITL